MSIRQPSENAPVRQVLWEEPQPLRGRLNTRANNHAPAISPDGRTMVFAHSDAGRNADLFVARWNGETWDEPQPIATLNTPSDELSPSISRDGQSLYFSSNRPGGLGGYDLWVARRQGDTWAEPVNLGPQFNSEFDETSPAISPDGDRLYFSSNRSKHERSEMDKLLGKKSSRQDYDIFVADLKASTTRSADELNSTYDDGPVALSPRGEFVYFASNRPGGLGGWDIYRSRILDDKLQPPQNLGEPVNSSANETDPAVWMEGYDLVFSSNRNSPDPQEFYLYHSVSREVVSRSDYSALLAYLRLFKKLKWLVLLSSLALVALLYLLRNFMDEQWRVRTSLLQKCLLGSALVHTVIAFLLSFWVISSAIYTTAQHPFTEVALDENALATERLSLDIREQITDLFQQSVPMPQQQKVEQLPPANVEPQKQEITPESAPTKLEAVAAATPTPISEQKQPDRLLPAEHAREIPKTQLASAPVQLESPQPIAPQTTKEFAPAPDAVDLRPVKIGARPQASAPLVAAVNISDGGPGQQLSQERSALDGDLPMSESQQTTTPGAAPLTPSTVPGSLQLPATQLAMETDTPSQPQGAGPQINPLKANRSLATAAAETPLPTFQPQGAPQQIAGDTAGSGSAQRSALEGDLPVSESTATARIKPSQAATKTAGDGVEIQAKLTMEAGTPTRSQGAGPEIQPLRSGQSLAAVADSPVPARQPAKMAANISSGEAGPSTPQRLALGQALPMAESAGTISGGSLKPPEVKALGGLQLSAKVSLETNKLAWSHGTGPQINPLRADTSLVTAAASEVRPPQLEPQKLAANVPTGAGASQTAQRSALDGNLPVLESQAASRLVAEKNGLTNTAGSLNMQARVSMEAEPAAKVSVETNKLAQSKGSGPQIDPLRVSASLVTAAAGETRPQLQQQPQKIAADFPASAGANQTAQRSALASRLPLQESQTATRLTAQDKSLTIVRGSVSFEVRVTMETEQPSKSASAPQEIKPTKSELSVASVASQFPAPQGVPQKLDQQITGGGMPGVFQPQSGPVRPMESTPTLIETRGPGQAQRLRIPALEMGASVTLTSSNPAPYALRDQKQRSRVLVSLGGSVQTESAIERSLEWFTHHQEPDGHWAIVKNGGLKGHDVGATSLALLCYMGWGAKHTEPGPHQVAMARGLDWLAKQVKYKGDMRGDGGTMYDHGMGTIALAEAYGLTKDPKLYEPLRKAVGFILYAQNSDTGGWRYIPGADGDTSVFGWQLMALKSAGLAGMDVPPHVLDKARGWLDRVASGEHGGLYGYQDKTPLPAMCAEGMFCQELLGLPPDDPRMEETATYLKTSLPSKDKEKINYYYWYYGSLALYQHQGPVWEQWNGQLRDILTKAQKIQGDESGSWDPAGQWSHECGRVVTTALATLSLEVYYRYLPLYGLTTASR